MILLGHYKIIRKWKGKYLAAEVSTWAPAETSAAKQCSSENEQEK